MLPPNAVKHEAAMGLLQAITDMHCAGEIAWVMHAENTDLMSYRSYIWCARSQSQPIVWVFQHPLHILGTTAHNIHIDKRLITLASQAWLHILL